MWEAGHSDSQKRGLKEITLVFACLPLCRLTAILANSSALFKFATSCSHPCWWQAWLIPAPSFLSPPRWTAVEVLSRTLRAFNIRLVEWTVTVFSVSLTQRQLLLTTTAGFMKTNLITPFTIANQWFLFLQGALTNASTHTSAWWNTNYKLYRLDEVCKRLTCKWRSAHTFPPHSLLSPCPWVLPYQHLVVGTCTCIMSGCTWRQGMTLYLKFGEIIQSLLSTWCKLVIFSLSS